MTPNDIWCAWFCGFVDGEGSFMLNLSIGRRLIAPQFRIGLTESELPILEEIQTMLDCGQIYRDAWTGKTKSKPKCVFTISSTRAIVSNLLPIIDAYGLRANKSKDYELFKEFCLRWHDEIVYKKPHDFEWAVRFAMRMREARISLKGKASELPSESRGTKSR